MAAWTEPQKVQIRHYTGSSILFAYGFYPFLESAMTTVLAQADGGAQVDNSTQLAIIATLADLADVESRIKSLRKRVMVDTAEAGQTKARIDPARGIAVLRQEGRRLAFGLARYLGLQSVLVDIFTAAPAHIPPVIGPDVYSSS